LEIYWILGSPLEAENLTPEPNGHGVHHGSLFTEIGAKIV